MKKKLKLIWLVLTNKVSFEKRYLTTTEILKRLENLIGKYYKDFHCSFQTQINKGNLLPEITYRLYTNSPYPESFIGANLELCFKKMEEFLINKPKQELPKDEINIEIENI